MALGVEFASVVVQVAQADRTLPGGLNEFAPTQHNYIEDEHLFRVGFMSTGEAGALVDHLLSLGLPPEAVTIEHGGCACSGSVTAKPVCRTRFIHSDGCSHGEWCDTQLSTTAGETSASARRTSSREVRSTWRASTSTGASARRARVAVT